MRMPSELTFLTNKAARRSGTGLASCSGKRRAPRVDVTTSERGTDRLVYTLTSLNSSEIKLVEESAKH